eukprot:629761_1
MSTRLSLGDSILVNTDKFDDDTNANGREVIGLIRYIGFIHGQKHRMTQYVGVELIQPISNGHNGTIDNYQYFTAPNGHGIHLPITDIARKLSTEDVTLKLRNVINLNNLFKHKLDQYLKAVTDRDDYIETLKQKHKHLKSLLSQTNEILKQHMFQTQTLSMTNTKSSSLTKANDNETLTTSPQMQLNECITPMTPANTCFTAAVNSMHLPIMVNMLNSDSIQSNNTDATPIGNPKMVNNKTDNNSNSTSYASTSNSQTIHTSSDPTTTTFTSTKAILEVIKDDQEEEGVTTHKQNVVLSKGKPQRIHVLPQQKHDKHPYVHHSSPILQSQLMQMDVHYNVHGMPQQQRNMYYAQSTVSTPPSNRSMHYKYQSIHSPIQYQIVSPTYVQIPVIQPVQRQNGVVAIGAPHAQPQPQQQKRVKQKKKSMAFNGYMSDQYQQQKCLQQSGSNEWTSNTGFVISNQYIYEDTL